MRCGRISAFVAVTLVLAGVAIACSARDVPDEQLRTEYLRELEQNRYAAQRRQGMESRRHRAAHRSVVRRTVRDWPESGSTAQRARMTATAVDIEGRIVAGSETPSGEVREVVISDGEQNYQVASQALRERLAKLLGRNVRLTGTVAGATQYSLVVNEARITLLN